MKTAAAILALTLLATAPAAAQIQPGPNLSPNGVPFTYAPRHGYIGPPGGWYWPRRGASFAPPPIEECPNEGIGGACEPTAGPPSPPPLGWVFTRYTTCPQPRSCPVVFVSVYADGLNVRTAPDGLPVMALVNGTPLVVLDRVGSWTLVAAACELTPTFLWSWTVPVPLNRCWIP